MKGWNYFMRRNGSPEPLKEWGFSVDGEFILGFKTLVKVAFGHYVLERYSEISDGNPMGGSVDKTRELIGIYDLGTSIAEIDVALMNETERLLEKSMQGHIKNAQRWGNVSDNCVKLENSVTGKIRRLGSTENVIIDYQI